MFASIPILIQWPVISTFGLYAFLVPLEATTVSETGEIFLTRLVGILAGAVLLATGLMERRLVRPPLAALWWVLLLVWAGLSVAWAIDSKLALQRLTTLLNLVLLYLVAVSMKPSRKEFYWVCLLATAGGMVAASMGYLSGAAGASGAAVRRGLVVGEQMTNPNAFGSVLILPLALALGGFVGQRSTIGKLVALGTLGVLGTGIYFTMSRGALLAFMVVILVFVYRIGIRWQVFISIALLAILVATMPEAFFLRMSTVFTGEDTTGTGRTVIWKAGIAALERFGMVGAGYGNYTAIYSFSEAYGFGPRKLAHNSYLGTWVELGIVGLALMLAALASHLLVVRGMRRANEGGVVLSSIEAACFGMLTSAFFGDRLADKSFWLLWILLTWALRSVAEPIKPQGNNHE